MSSRAEEKARRREQRIAQERQELASAQRARRLQIVGASILAVALVAVVAIVALGSGGGSSSSAVSPNTAGAQIPAAGPDATASGLTAAAKAAGCTVKSFTSEGRTHTTSKVTYKTNPPTSGPHDPTPADDGIYDPGNTPAKEHYVHTLEHGRVELQYKPGTSKHVIAQLTTLFNEPLNGTPGYHTLLFENNTGMPYAVAETAWTHLIGCPTVTPKVWDALRAFRAAYVDKAPEQIP